MRGQNVTVNLLPLCFVASVLKPNFDLNRKGDISHSSFHDYYMMHH